MKFAVALTFTLFTFTAIAQARYNAALLDTLQQIASAKTSSKYFAQLYYQAIEITNKYAHGQPDSVKDFIFGFEALFAPVFFQSHKNFVAHTSQVYNWQQYYADTTLNELQYKFIGMNAHINGDMWVALKDRYGYDTLKKYRRPLLKFQKALNSFFDSIYTTSRKYKNLGRLHFLALGLDKKIGRAMVLQWRKKQVQLALLYYTNPGKCERKCKRLQRKMCRWNRFAIKWIK